MAKKTFFAAFVIDEEAYTPEPGPVDRHFVVADLAQSSFGEQYGVSSFIVWESVEDLITDHRQQGPITVDYLLGEDICADSVAVNRNTSEKGVVTPLAAPGPSFRDHLSPAMRDTLAFEYFEVRPCIERDRQVTSYRDEDEFADELARTQKGAKEFRAFWSLYGVDRSSTTAIGDFISKDAAHEVMNAILAVPAAVRNAVSAEISARRQNGAAVEQAARSAADWLDDMINQSSSDQRI
ncbi:hypothetical protein GTW25_16010 [Aliihoeflea aestuarii]|uniref:hypothetical protein n=1 Tax=Aliihoeflea aestuarii TaxID=453840 RepID=UPI00209558A1|nr:hypothetical protein [Aliihoeflea aestuarii]MCO6392530.1 hypothetical protein [Aliihoeflea aestuarii]